MKSSDEYEFVTRTIERFTTRTQAALDEAANARKVAGDMAKAATQAQHDALVQGLRAMEAIDVLREVVERFDACDTPSFNNALEAARALLKKEDGK